MDRQQIHLFYMDLENNLLKAITTNLFLEYNNSLF